jgi:polar amino acid transport system permease protein
MFDSWGALAFGPTGWGDELLRATGLTLALAVATLPFGLALGLVVALAKASTNPVSRLFGNAFTTVFRGLPELLTILIIYFGLQIGINKLLAAISPGLRFEINQFVAGMIALSVVLAAFSSEVWLGAMRGISRGQYEGGEALGLSRGQCFRLVVLPQLLRLALPGLGNNWLVLLKDTSLVSVIALNELMYQSRVAVSNTKEPILIYTITCLLYLIMAIVSSIGIAQLEKRLARGQTRAT